MAFKSLLFVSILIAAMAASAPKFINILSQNISIPGISHNKMMFLLSDALMQLQCNGNVVSTATTNASEIFSIVLDPLQYVLSLLLTNYTLVVNTPLANCNAKLPAVGGLISSLQFIGNTLLGLLNIANIIPSGFQFMP